MTIDAAVLVPTRNSVLGSFSKKTVVTSWPGATMNESPKSSRRVCPRYCRY